MKPIEPGCLCLSTYPDPYFSGECIAEKHLPTGTVITVGKHSLKILVDSWAVRYTHNPDVGRVCIHTRYLIRIDGHESLDTVEKDNEIEIT